MEQQCSLLLKKSEEIAFNFFTKFCHNYMNNGNSKDYKFIKWF